MAEELKLHHPWLVAVWPGMGHVAISAGYYLMAKLEMHLLAEFSPRELFDTEHVEVKGGLIRIAGLPRSRFFVWTDPAKQHDLVVFLGDAQPPGGKHPFCCRLIDFAQQLGIERVFTFAAMATQMHPEQESRVFGAAIDEDSLAELKRLELEILEDGQIGGLNGVLLGVAAEVGLTGACLLGEMPHIFVQFPYPKAALSVLKVFTTMTGIQLDMSELAEEAKASDQQLAKMLERVRRSLGQVPEEEEEPAFSAELAEEERPEEGRPSAAELRKIEQLFEQAGRDRSKAYELKQELDRLGAFKDYEDRFLDLFKKNGA